MSLRLERNPGAALVRATLALALAAAMLAVSPVAAEAQTRDEGAPSVVVRQGDSLWSISEGLLGPNASPRRVMRGAERIHALNRERIGADPGLVIAGQELSVPRAMSEKTPNGAAKGPAVKEAPREASGQGDIPRSGVSLEGVTRTLGADTKDKANLPDPRAAALVPDVRTVASKGAQPGALFGILSDTSAGDRRRLLGLGIWALTLLLAALIVALGRGAPLRKARKRDLWFRETYGRPYAALGSFADPGGGSERTTAAWERQASPDGQTYEGAVSEDRFDLTDPFVLARARRARVRRQSPRPRPRGLRRPVRTRAQGRPSDRRQKATVRAIRKDWEPGAALVGALGGMPLTLWKDPGGNLAVLEPHLLEALGELRRLGQWRGLSEREEMRKEALEALMAATEKAE